MAAGRSQAHFGPGQVALEIPSLGQGRGLAGGRLGAGQGLEFVEGAATESQADRAKAHGEQAELRNSVEGFLGGGKRLPSRDEILGDLHVFHGKVRTARSCEPGDVPGVEKFDAVCRHNHHIHARIASFVRDGFAVAKVSATGHDPMGILGSRSEGPATRNAKAALESVGAAFRRVDPGDDSFRAVEDSLDSTLGQVRDREGGRNRDGHAPGHRGLGFGQYLEDLERRAQGQFESAQSLGNPHAVEALVREGAGYVIGHPAKGFDLRGTRREFGRDLGRSLQHGGGCLVLGSRHVFFLRYRARPSRLAILFFCISEDPPTMGIPIKSRTWRSMEWPSESP